MDSLRRVPKSRAQFEILNLPIYKNGTLLKSKKISRRNVFKSFKLNYGKYFNVIFGMKFEFIIIWFDNRSKKLFEHAILHNVWVTRFFVQLTVLFTVQNILILN